MESTKQRLSERELIRIYWVDELLILILFCIVFLFIVDPFIIEGILNQEPYWYNPRDRQFLEGIIGWYDYGIHAVLLLVCMAVGMCVGIFIGSLTLRFAGERRFREEPNNRSAKIILLVATCVPGILIILGVIASFMNVSFPIGFLDSIVEGIFIGILIGGHLSIRNIRREYIATPTKREKLVVIGSILGLLAATMLMAMGVIVALSNKVPPYVPVPYWRVVAGMNLILGTLIATSAALMWKKHSFSGSVLAIIFSYLSIGVGGGFMIGIILGFLGGILGLSRAGCV